MNKLLTRFKASEHGGEYIMRFISAWIIVRGLVEDDRFILIFIIVNGLLGKIPKYLAVLLYCKIVEHFGIS